MFQYEWLKVCLWNEMKELTSLHLHMEEFEEQAVMASAHHKLGS